MIRDRYQTYQKSFIKHCPNNGIILDIGSGAYPFPNATILADKFLETSQHRSEKIVLDNRDFVILDIEFLPFKNKTIEYVYCSHVLEHVNNPERACRELMRSAKAGYIETPNFMRDMLFAWAKGMHKWHTLKNKNTLFFFEYSDRELEGVRSDYWRKTVLNYFHHPNQDIFYPNQDIFNTMFEWENDFVIVVYPLEDKNPENQSEVSNY